MLKHHMNFVYYSNRVAAIVAGLVIVDAHNNIYNYSVYNNNNTSTNRANRNTL